MHQVTRQEVESHIADVLGTVMRGEEIIVTDHDTPVVKMIPLTREKLPAFGSATEKHFTFSWASALSDLRDSYTSTELQKKSLEWMSKL